MSSNADCGEAHEIDCSGVTSSQPQDYGITRSQAWSLYTSHFLSTWNIRTYEFAAIIFTAAAYPDTLSAAAIRGIMRTLASMALSSTVGRWVDKSPDRLRTLLTTITVNRIVVLTCCPLWYLIVAESLLLSGNQVFKAGVFAIILILGTFENLSASGNMLSMERDWVITVAQPAGCEYDLTHLNSVMRRIDLVCKLIAPILISVTISSTNARVGAVVVGGMSGASWALESFCARRVWSCNERLKTPKMPKQSSITSSSGILSHAKRYFKELTAYFRSSVMIPSMSLSLLHLSILSYGATLVTFLLSAGFSLELITIARAAGSLVEISSTVITPVGVRILGEAYSTHGRHRGEERQSDEGAVLLEHGETTLGENEAEQRAETGLERFGLWGLTFQLMNLVLKSLSRHIKHSSNEFQIPVVLILQTFIPSSTGDESSLLYYLPMKSIFSPTISAFSFFSFLSISRLGLWIFDLTTQQLTQTMVSPSFRSSFTGVEYSSVALFELIQHIVMLVLNRPEDFKYLAVGSLLTVGVSAGAYAGVSKYLEFH